MEIPFAPIKYIYKKKIYTPGLYIEHQRFQLVEKKKLPKSINNYPR